MLPATSAGIPAVSNMAPSSAVVVVLPLVPVMPMIGFASRRAPSSISEMTGIPSCTRSHNGRRLGGDAGALDDELDTEEERVAPLTDEDLAVDPVDVEIAPGVIADDVGATGVDGGGSRAAGARQADDENASRDWRHACKPRGRTHVRCATTIPPTINALPIAIGSVTLSPSTIAASADPETGCRNCSVAILAMPPRSRAQYQPI